MKCKFAIVLITSIISILHAKGYPIAWGYIYRYIDGQLVPVSGAKPLILEGIPPYFPPPSTNQAFDFESDVLLFTADSNSNARKNCTINFYPLCNWSDSGFSVFDVKFFSINNRNFIALTGQYTTPLQFRFRIIEYFPETQNLSLKLDLNLPWTTRIFADPPFVYVGMREYGIKVVNFSKPESPETLTISGIRAHDIWGDDQYLYVASGTGLAVINKSDFNVAYTWSDSGERNYTIAYNPATQKVYLSHRYSMVRIFDASNPPNLIVLDSLISPGDYFDVGAWNHDTLFVIRTPLMGFSLFKEDGTNCGSYEHDYGMVYPYAGIARSPYLYVCWEVQGIHKYLYSAGEFQLIGFFQPDTTWYGAVESCDIIDDSTIIIGADNKGIYILRERSVRVEECVSCKNIKINALYSSGTLKLDIPPQVGLPASIEIFTIDGKRIYSTTLNRSGLQTIKIPLVSGVYLLVLKGKNRYTGKFVSVK
jgi:hypothetical protein